MLDDDIQREIFRDTVDPEKTLSIAVNMQMGHQTNSEYLQTTTTTTQISNVSST